MQHFNSDRLLAKIFIRSLGAALLFSPTAAYAIYTQEVDLQTGTGEEIPTSLISFEPADGSTVTVEEDDDDGSIALIFPGDRSVPGTLVIDRPDGPAIRIAIPAAGPGERITVDVPRRTARVVRDPSGPGDRSGPPRATISLIGGFGAVEAPPVGTGVLIEGGGESFAAELDDSVGIPFGGLSVGIPAGPGTLNLFGGYGEGSDDISTSVPAGGGIDVGFVNTDFAPSGSTGVFLGNAGLDTSLMRDVNVLSFGGSYALPIGGSPEKGKIWDAYFSLEYSRTEQSIWGNVTSPSFGNDISSTINQEVSDRYITLGAGPRLRGQSDSGFFYYIGAQALLVHHRGELQSNQSVICNLCGAADQAFTIDLAEHTDGVTFGARGKAGFGIEISNGTSIGAYGFAEYYDERGQIVNPRTGDDLFIRNQPTALGSQSATNYGGAVVFTIGL